jgi:AraC family transcriptional regulator
MIVSQRDLQRVNHAIEYVTRNLSAKITVADIAAQVHVSEFHFHRIFKTVTNETFNKYLQRKKLEQALFELRSPKRQSIHQISVNCGFSSQANFAKAFNAYFGFSASAFRKGGCENISRNGKVFSKIGNKSQQPYLYNGSLSTDDWITLKKQNLDLQVINLPTEYYCYVASTMGYSMEGIEQAWTQLRELLASIDISCNDISQTAGFCLDSHYLTPLPQCRYEAAFCIKDVQQLEQNGIAYRTLAAGRYLSAKYKGKISELRHPYYLWLFSEYIPEHKLILCSKEVVERYKNVDMKNDFIELEILIKVY